MHVGHTVTQKYLLAKQLGEALILDLTDSPYFLQDITMGARDLVAGNVDLRVLSGGPVTVTVLSVSPGIDPGRSWMVRFWPATGITAPASLR